MYLESFFRNDTIYIYNLNLISTDDTIYSTNPPAKPGEFHFARGFGQATITGFAPGNTIHFDNFNIAGFEMLAPFIDPASPTLRITLTYNGAIEQLDVPALARADATAAMFALGHWPSLAQITGTALADTLFAAARPAASVEGLGGDDALVGTTGSERLDGGPGDDLLYQWDGNDTLIGGPGTDTAIYAAPRASYRVALAGDTILVQGTWGIATLTEIEALRFADTPAISLAELRADATIDEAAVSVAGGTPAFLLPAPYAGPLNLAYQFAGTDAADVMAGTGRNDFANLGSGDDAADMGRGDDIVDGGNGSNFLVGGAGRDIFFCDGRGLATTWSTIADWQAGEQLSLWGWQPGISTLAWAESDGAEGYRGATLHADLDGNGLTDTSITWSGLTRTDLPAPHAFADQALLWFVAP